MSTSRFKPGPANRGPNHKSYEPQGVAAGGWDRAVLNALAQECHDISVSKGFYDPPPTIEQRLCLIHSEVSEALEEHRDGHAPTDERYTKPRGDDGPSKPEGIPSEFADIIIRVLDASAYYGIDIGRAVREKLEYNKTRPHKHGRVI